MKKQIITIKAKELNPRNWMHFEIQLHNRMLIRNSKKLYNRNAMKRETRTLAYQY